MGNCFLNPGIDLQVWSISTYNMVTRQLESTDHTYQKIILIYNSEVHGYELEGPEREYVQHLKAGMRYMIVECLKTRCIQHIQRQPNMVMNVSSLSSFEIDPLYLWSHQTGCAFDTCQVSLNRGPQTAKIQYGEGRASNHSCDRLILGVSHGMKYSVS